MCEESEIRQKDGREKSQPDRRTWKFTEFREGNYCVLPEIRMVGPAEARKITRFGGNSSVKGRPGTRESRTSKVREFPLIFQRRA
jgi:hypothetical protein